MHMLFSSFASIPGSAALRRCKHNREALLEAYGELQGRHVVLEESWRQLKENYEGLQLEHLELKAAYAKLKTEKNATNDVANKKFEGVNAKCKEDADDNNASHRHHDDGYDEFELVDAVKEKLVPQDDANLNDTKYAPNQTI